MGGREDGLRTIGGRLGAASTTIHSSALLGRFLVWKGVTGRTYVFSRVDDRRDLDGAIVVEARLDRRSATILGDPRIGRPNQAEPAGEGEIWAHFLAEDASARARALADLIAGGRRPEIFGAPDRSLRAAA